MPIEPIYKRAIAFVDGQNLFHAAKEAFGYSYPNYDPLALAKEICAIKSWVLQKVKFYTGIHSPEDNVAWNHFWTKKLAVMGSRGVQTFSRQLRYRIQTVTLDSHTTTPILVGQEKGIDIRIALDIVRLALDQQFDVALIFSQDQDLSEVADEIRTISKQQNRWIKVACAYPSSPTLRNRRGINGTEWIRIDKTLFDKCLDPNDYRQ